MVPNSMLSNTVGGDRLPLVDIAGGVISRVGLIGPRVMGIDVDGEVGYIQVGDNKLFYHSR